MRTDGDKGADPWLALMIGNSRLHWGWFQGETLQHTWDTSYLSVAAIASLIQQPMQWQHVLTAMPPLTDHPPLWLASVVPQQTQHWQGYPDLYVLGLPDLALPGLYPTLGIDRALALRAVMQPGVPALAIDAGTALTFTGADATGRLVGGAILPGVQLQLQALAIRTAALPLIAAPLLSPLPSSLPSRWALNTTDAMQSGILYGVMATIQDFVQAWLHEYPTSAIALTGGDCQGLFDAMQQRHPHLAAQITVNPDLVLQGMAAIRQSITTSPDSE